MSENSPCAGWLAKCKVPGVVTLAGHIGTEKALFGRLIRFVTGLEHHEIVAVCAGTFSEWDNDRVPRLSASLAFYTLLSAAPLVIVVVAVAALAYGEDAARGQLAWQIRGLVGFETANGIQDLLRNAYKPGSGLLASILGLLVLAVGASSVVVELRDALNTIWHVPPAQTARGISSVVFLLKERLYAFALVIGGGLLLLLSMALSVWIAALGKLLGPFLPVPEFVLHAITFILSLLAIALLFGAVYKVVPEVPLKWSDVVVGACVTAFLFTVGKQLISIYLGRSTLGSAYGAAGSLVVLLVWVYYSAQLFFLGAEFTKVYTRVRIAAGKREPASA